MRALAYVLIFVHCLACTSWAVVRPDAVGPDQTVRVERDDHVVVAKHATSCPGTETLSGNVVKDDDSMLLVPATCGCAAPPCEGVDVRNALVQTKVPSPGKTAALVIGTSVGGIAFVAFLVLFAMYATAQTTTP